jgi:spore coat protein U-like protein
VPSAACAQAASSAHVDIELRATVAERCGIARTGSDPAAMPDLDTAQSLRFAFQVDCNTPFAIAVSSANGALRMQQNGGPISTGPGDARTPDGFAADKSYQVALSLDTDAGSISSQPCNSRDLTNSGGKCAFYGTVPGTGLSSGGRTAMGRDGALTVSWKSGDENGVRHAAGTYQDTLTVVVGPRA